MLKFNGKVQALVGIVAVWVSLVGYVLNASYNAHTPEVTYPSVFLSKALSLGPGNKATVEFALENARYVADVPAGIRAGEQLICDRTESFVPTDRRATYSVRVTCQRHSDGNR